MLEEFDNEIYVSLIVFLCTVGFVILVILYISIYDNIRYKKLKKKANKDYVDIIEANLYGAIKSKKSENETRP